MTDLDAPVLRRTFVHGVESTDHNQYILGDYVFQANYDSGLRVLRIDAENFDLELVICSHRSCSIKINHHNHIQFP